MPDPRYSSFGQGVLGGLIGNIQRRRQEESEMENESRQNALKWLQTIPATEHNMPIVTRMALDILGSKPSKKHWSDSLFGTGVASTKYVDDLWTRLKGILPPNDDIAQERPAVPQPPSLPAPSRESIGNIPRGVTEAVSPAATVYAGMARAVAPTARVPRPGILEFSSQGQQGQQGQQGKWKTLPQVYQDAEGNDFLVQMDEKLGQTRKVPLGQISTEKQLIEQQRAQTKSALAKEAMSKGLMGKVLAAAAQAGITPEQFWSMPVENQIPFYNAAGGQTMRYGSAQIGNLEAAAEKNKAQAQYYGQQAATAAETGGLTAGQSLTNFQQNRTQAIKYKQEFDELKAKAEAASLALQTYEDTPSAVKGAPSWQRRKLELQREFESAYAAATAKATEAAKVFPDFLEGGSGTSDDSGRPWPYLNIREGSLPRAGTSPGVGNTNRRFPTIPPLTIPVQPRR